MLYIHVFCYWDMKLAYMYMYVTNSIAILQLVSFGLVRLEHEPIMHLHVLRKKKTINVFRLLISVSWDQY